MTTKPKPFVFTLMPFEPSFNDVYKLGIKPACTEVGAYCERVDEQIFTESILDRIYNQISKSDLIVADMTGRNPNVFYETGYAHALGKRVVLITKDSDDIPFDLKHYSHIVYGGSISDLKEKLQEHVTWFLSHPIEEEVEEVQWMKELPFYLNEVAHEHDMVVDVVCRKDRYEDYVVVELPISWQNVKNVTLPRFYETIYLNVISDFLVEGCSVADEVHRLPDGTYLYSSIVGGADDVPPSGWIFHSICLGFPEISYSGFVEKTWLLDCAFVLYGKEGQESLPFRIKVGNSGK